MSLPRAALALRKLLDHPSRVFLLSLLFLAGSILFNGTLWRLWGLHRDEERIHTEIEATRGEISRLNRQLRQAKDPAFIERQARDRLDLVGEKDLVFVFPDP